jgi:hypothetical protein
MDKTTGGIPGSIFGMMKGIYSEVLAKKRREEGGNGGRAQLMC